MSPRASESTPPRPAGSEGGPKILQFGSVALGEELDGPRSESVLVGLDPVHPQGLEVPDGGVQPDSFGDRRGPGLELPGKIVRREAVQAHVADHLAAAEERRHRLEELLTAPQHADARRPEHLVAREGEEVDTERADVDAAVGDELGGVDDDDGSGGVRRLDDRAQVVDRAEHVRHGRDADEPDTVDEPVEVAQVEPVVRRDGEVAELHAGVRRRA